MDFHPPEAIAQRLDAVRAFVTERLAPAEATLRQDGFFAALPALEALREEVRAMGLFSPHVARAHGGAGLSLLAFAFLAEELGRSAAGHYVFNCQAPDAGNMELLAQHGTAAQRAQFLAPLVQGAVRSCFAMTEPERAGSNPAWLAATARREGGEYVLDAHKWFTTGAEGAAFAIVMAVTEPEAKSPYARASMLLVPMDAAGVTRVRNVAVMGEAGEGWFSHAELRFEGVRVPEANRLGEEGQGFRLAQERLGPGRIHHCMRWVGICERAFDLMCRQAVSRELSPGKPLGTTQLAQVAIAQSRAEIDAARMLVLKAAWRIEQEGAAAARDDIAAIKFFGAGVLQRVLDRAIQLHGALGLTEDTPLAFWFRHERAARIYDGADEVHQTKLGQRILEGYGLKPKGT
jgi:alkylation response protein AidB-like acyl-CoA dehydrogenase